MFVFDDYQAVCICETVCRATGWITHFLLSGRQRLSASGFLLVSPKAERLTDGNVGQFALALRLCEIEDTGNFCRFRCKKIVRKRVKTPEMETTPGTRGDDLMLNAIGNLLASPRPRTSRRRVPGLLTTQHLEARLALTASVLAPTVVAPTVVAPTVVAPVVGPIQGPVVAEQTVVEATEEHSYPVEEGAAEYSDSEPLLMGAPATLVLSLDGSGESEEITAQEVQFPDTNQVADNTAFFESVQSSPQQAVVADGQEPVQSPLPLESVGRARLESSPSLSPIELIAEEEAPNEDGDTDELESDSIDGEDPPGESAAVTEDLPPLVDEAVMALDMDIPREDIESGKAESMAKPAVTSDMSQAETADNDVQQTSASAALDAVTIETSDLDEFFSREQSTVAPHQKAMATAAVVLLGAAQMRRSRRQSELAGDQGL